MNIRSGENAQRESSSGFGVRSDAVHVAADNTAIDVLIDKGIDRRVGCFCNPGRRFVRNKRVACAVPEYRGIQDESPRRQIGEAQTQVIHGQLRQVRDIYTILETLEFLARLLQQSLVEVGSAGDKNDTLSTRMQSQGEVECRAELTLDEYAGNVRRQCAWQLSFVDAAEDNGNIWKNPLTVPEQETQRGLHGCNHDVDRFGCILGSEIVPCFDLVRLPSKA